MRTLRIRVPLVLSIILASPIVALAAPGGGEGSLWEWIVRLLIQAAGGWFQY